jgi:hypothetical protein
MKRFLKGFVASMLLVGCVQAGTYHDRTFLMPRSHNDNLAMEYTAWHDQIYKKGIKEDFFGGTFQSVPFYQMSSNTRALGYYFGVKYGIHHQDYLGVEWTTGGGASATVPLNSLNVIHDRNVAYAAGETTLANGIRFRPDQESLGVHLDYHQKLDKLIEGLYMQLELPIVYVKNSINATATSAITTQPLVVSGGTAAGTEVSILDYLAGNVENTVAGYKQEKLTCAKIDGSQSETNLADLDIKLGYHFLYRDKKHISAYASLTVPLGNTPSGEYLFEPVIGNGKHFATGGGIDLSFEAWKQENKSLDLGFVVDYKYIWSATEKRTLGFRWPTVLTAVPFGHYWLAAEVGGSTTFPFANVLTRDVCVTPGSQVDLIVNTAFHWNEFIFDLGYNLFAKEGESVTVKYWPDDKYAVAVYSWDQSAVFSASSHSHASYGAINATHLLVSPATTPAQVTHKIYASTGYTFDWKYPVFVGLGSSYEFVSGINSALQNYAFWGKVGLTF